jgi:hypothetical protein
MKAGQKRRKNVLLITADQIRADCLQSSFVQTPNLDALIGDGAASFSQHYCQSTPCAPARASLHTGCYLMNHHVHDNGAPLTEGLSNWAQEAKLQADYQPTLVGYVDQTPDTRTHAADDPKYRDWEGGFLPGLDRLTETDSIGTKEWLEERGIPTAGAPDGQGWNGYNGATWWLELRQEVTDTNTASESGTAFPQAAAYSAEDTDTRLLTDRAIQFIEQQHKEQQSAEMQSESANKDGERGGAGESCGRGGVADRPGWMLHLSLRAPHPPWVAAEPFNSMYAPDDIAKEAACAACSTTRAESVEAEASTHDWLRLVHSQEGKGAAGELLIQRRIFLLCYYYNGAVGEVAITTSSFTLRTSLIVLVIHRRLRDADEHSSQPRCNPQQPHFVSYPQEGLAPLPRALPTSSSCRPRVHTSRSSQRSTQT